MFFTVLLSAGLFEARLVVLVVMAGSRDFQIPAERLVGVIRERERG